MASDSSCMYMYHAYDVILTVAFCAHTTLVTIIQGLVFWVQEYYSNLTAHDYSHFSANKKSCVCVVCTYSNGIKINIEGETQNCVLGALWSIPKSSTP